MITDSQLNGYGERFLDFLKNSSDSQVITLGRLSNIVKKDDMIQLFFSKLNLYDIIRVIYYTYFLSLGVKQDDIFILLDKIFIYTMNDYDDKSYIDVECGECYGDGSVECSNCDGTGREDCGACDGDGSVDCDSCEGSGKEECYYCDGKGSETEEDDEGDETEVECVHCDGEGTENCRSCGGAGDFECLRCDGKRYENCSSCEGLGTEYCKYCKGVGNYESEELYYTDSSISYGVTLDNNIFRFEDTPMEDEDFLDEIENSFTILFRRLIENISVDSIDSEYGTNDLDRVVIVSNIREITDSNYHNFSEANFF